MVYRLCVCWLVCADTIQNLYKILNSIWEINNIFFCSLFLNITTWSEAYNAFYDSMILLSIWNWYHS